MEDITINISKKELSEVIAAYRTLHAFLERFVSPNELYLTEFLTGLEDAQNDVRENNLVEVKSFADFIQ
jgi:hypothetical protein